MVSEMEQFSKASTVINFLYFTKRAEYSPLILICGRQGSGKTMAGLAIAYALKLRGLYEFDMSKNVLHSVEAFVSRLLQEDCKNQVLIVDEAQVKLNSQEFWNEFNIAFGKIIASQRYLQNCYIIITPLAVSLAKGTRRFCDVKIEMLKKRFGSWTIIKRRYGEMGFSFKKSPIWEYRVPSVLMIPKLDNSVIEEYKRIEKKDKREILEDIASSLDLSHRKNVYGENLPIWVYE